MNCVESRRAGGGIRLTPPSLKASCNYFFKKASRVNILSKNILASTAVTTDYTDEINCVLGRFTATVVIPPVSAK